MRLCCALHYVHTQGNKVKLVMKFEGRELQFKEQGKQVMLVRTWRHTCASTHTYRVSHHKQPCHACATVCCVA